MYRLTDGGLTSPIRGLTTFLCSIWIGVPQRLRFMWVRVLVSLVFRRMEQRLLLPIAATILFRLSIRRDWRCARRSTSAFIPRILLFFLIPARHLFPALDRGRWLALSSRRTR